MSDHQDNDAPVERLDEKELAAERDEERLDEERLEDERWRLLHRLESWLEGPMLILSAVWLVLLVIEFTWGFDPILEAIFYAAWGMFIVDYGLKFILAPDKFRYFLSSWLSFVALFVPALRVLRVLRLLRFVQIARSAQLVRVVASLNRGMRALGASMGRRGFQYVLALTLIITIAGGAGMYFFEAGRTAGFETYGDALWFTGMLLISMGSGHWPETIEGRILAFLVSLYGFGVFGYLTATLATFFIGRDADDEDAELASGRELRELKEEIVRLREELRASRGATGGE